MEKQNLKITDFELLSDNILVKGFHITERKGVKIPSSSETKTDLGEIIGIGSGRIDDNGNTISIKVQVGDYVYFNKYMPDQFNIDGDIYYIIKEDEIIGYLRP